MFFNFSANVNSKPIASDYYYYLASDNFKGFIPNGCVRTWIKTTEAITANIKCSVPLAGKYAPNDKSWPASLSFQYNSIADLKTGKVTLCKIAFEGFKEYDLTQSTPGGTAASLDKSASMIGITSILKVNYNTSNTITIDVRVNEKL